MSAKHDKRYGVIYCINESMFEILEPLLVSEFDLGVDEDIRNIEMNAKADKFLKRSCLVKVLSYPLEAAILWVYGSPEMRHDRFASTKLYIAFIRNKITKEQLNEKLTEQSVEMTRKFRG